jgi:hypothetical protein
LLLLPRMAGCLPGRIAGAPNAEHGVLMHLPCFLGVCHLC